MTAHKGTFLADMNFKKVTHLVCRKAEGNKYLSAKKKNIPIVVSQWVRESVKKGKPSTVYFVTIILG